MAVGRSSRDASGNPRHSSSYPGHRSPGSRTGSRSRTRKTRLVRRSIAAVLAVFIIVVGWSVGHALTLKGGGSVAARLAEWARDHGLGPAVTLGEWLTYEPPRVGGKPSFALNGGPSLGTQSHGSTPIRHLHKQIVVYPVPHNLRTLAGTPLHGEGVWHLVATVHGQPAIFRTYLRASSVYTSYVAGLAWMDPRLLRFQLRPGTQDPGPGQWGAQPYLPAGTRSGLLATFNNGFRLDVSGGGFYLHGRTAVRLQPGAASEVYYKNGGLSIGVWDRTVHMTPQVEGVRQNLRLIVQNGKIPASVNYNVQGAWGATLGGGAYVWRSAIGVTRHGDVVFAYGPELNVYELARLLQRAGVVTGMELDINPDWMSYMYYIPGGHPADPKPYNLLPDQIQPPDRYFYYSSRDFTAVYAR